MDDLLLFYLTCLGFLVLLITGISIRAFLQWETPGARILGLLTACMAVWAGFYLVELLVPGLGAKILAHKILYLGMTLSPVIWFWFALRYTGIGMGRVRRKHIPLLAIPGGIAFLLGLTNESHRLIWASLSLSDYQPAPLKIEYGAGFWMYTVVAYAFILAGIAMYIHAYLSHGRLFRVKSGIVLAGVILTTITNLLFLYFENGIEIDPTPLSFGLSAPLIALGFFRFGVAGLFPLAASLVVETLQDAILVVNREDEVTDLNRAAIRMFGWNSRDDYESVFVILPQAERIKEIWHTPEARIQLEIPGGLASAWYEVRVIPIARNEQNLLGRVIVFHDITHERRLLEAERRRSQQHSLLEEAGRRIADSFEEMEILQRAVDIIIERFQYPEAAISVLTQDNLLKAAAIAGTGHHGYEPGYSQPLGAGIIGHTAKIQQTYLSNNVGKDPYYFSTFDFFGSALCVPIWKQGGLFGVLYVESTQTNAFDDLDVKTLEALASQVSGSLQRAALYAQTQSDLRTLTAIMEISKLAASSLDLDTISRTAVQTLKETFRYTHVSIYFLKDDYLHLAAEVGYPKSMVIEKIHISQGVTGRAVRERALQFIEDTGKEAAYLKADNFIVSEICVPLVKDNAVLGVLNVESDLQGRLTQADAGFLTAIAGTIAVACDNARLLAELKKMATTDAVTGLSNRHIFEQALHAEVGRAERIGNQLSLIIFDIDSFKEYNDTWGHPAGDARLKAVADIIKLNLRNYDIAARYGGDEFAIILSDCSQQDALAFAQRLSLAVQADAPTPRKDEQGEPGHTLSIGIATFPRDAPTPSELLIAADHASLRAKQLGKNRIKLASDYETT